MTYECAICLNINHTIKTHCSTCGVIPARYSILAVPEASSAHCEAVIARGADRAEHHRTVRVYLRTVKADYYAHV